MNTDSKLCYRAVKSRDARFDGRFFTGVVSTGIFCRPVCPAPTPKAENCQFFADAAAAMNAGFRPCLRCRPEAAPGSPAWNGVSTTVNRAMRLIGEGALDDGGSVAALADRLGMGERHLRRLFLEHVGVGPKAVAQTRRVLFAKKLIGETNLSLTDIALAAGFGSIRRFNATFLEIYGRPPRELRRLEGEEAGAADVPLQLKLAVRPPYDWPGIVGFFKSRAIPGVEDVGEGHYRRGLHFDGRGGWLEVRPDGAGRHLRVSVRLDDTRHLKTVMERCRRLFDTDADRDAINAHLGRDPVLAAAVERHPGLRLPGGWEPFEIAVRAVLGQQVSVAAARTFAGRLCEAWGAPLKGTPPRGLSRLFPTPQALARARDLTVIGLTRRRAETLHGLAKAFADGSLDLEQAQDLADLETRLTTLPGIGPWTARYIAMRAFSEPDAFPSGDLGLLRAMRTENPEMTARELDRRAEGWRPWRAYAALHLWSLPPAATKDGTS